MPPSLEDAICHNNLPHGVEGMVEKEELDFPDRMKSKLGLKGQLGVDLEKDKIILCQGNNKGQSLV